MMKLTKDELVLAKLQVASSKSGVFEKMEHAVRISHEWFGIGGGTSIEVHEACKAAIEALDKKEKQK